MPGPIPRVPELDAIHKTRFEINPKLQREFGNFETYLAWLARRTSPAAPIGTGQAGEAVPADDDAARGLFAASPALQSEFGSGGVGFYVAYCRAVRGGVAKIYRVPVAADLDKSIPATDDAAREMFAASPALQNEFGEVETFVAWARGSRGDSRAPRR